MGAFSGILYLFLHFSLIFGYSVKKPSVSDDENDIVWPTEYHFSGERLDFTTTIKETFEIWHSDEQKRSRYDYYGGSTKEYYYDDKGYKLTLYPISNNNMSSTMSCKLDRSKRPRHQYLPHIEYSQFTFTGKEINLFDKIVKVYTRGSNTLYVYKSNTSYHIPVQYISKFIDSERGTIEDTTITNFFNFRSSVSEEELTADEESCHDLERKEEDFKNNNLNMNTDVPQDLDIAFDSYANNHNRQYQEDEIQLRKEIFEKNWRMVHEHNSKNLGFKLALNAFSDRTPEELQYYTGGTYFRDLADDDDGAQEFPHTVEEIDDIVQELPKEFDLRIEGYVTPVKHQASCGSCWAFATTGAIEGALAKAYGKLVDLSEQYLVDCTWPYGSKGCHGGFARDAVKLITDYGIPTERDYGVYKAKDDYCNILNMTNTYKIKSYVKVTPLNPNALKVALYKYGTVAIRVRTDPFMMHYKNGIFYDFYCERMTSQEINHAVVAVGYGSRDGEDYWIVKNSWGEVWGEDGYILMSARNNNCLVLNEPLYIVV